MFSLHDRRLPLLLTTLLFLIPLNIFVIGEWIGSGVQWALFKYQTFFMGNSLITIGNDLEYVSMGAYTGKTAFSVYLWVAGVAVLIVALLLLLAAVADAEKDRDPRFPGLLIVSGGFFFLASCMSQYGFLLNGPAGFAIPFGIPLVWVVGWWVYRGGSGEEEGEMGDEDVSETDATGEMEQ